MSSQLKLGSNHTEPPYADPFDLIELTIARSNDRVWPNDHDTKTMNEIANTLDQFGIDLYELLDAKYTEKEVTQ